MIQTGLTFDFCKDNLALVTETNVFGTCRDVLELEEAIKIKDGEAESYISEIEVFC